MGAVHISLSVAYGRGGGAPRVKGKDPENSQSRTRGKKPNGTEWRKNPQGLTGALATSRSSKRGQLDREQG